MSKSLELVLKNATSFWRLYRIRWHYCCSWHVEIALASCLSSSWTSFVRNSNCFPNRFAELAHRSFCRSSFVKDERSFKVRTDSGLEVICVCSPFAFSCVWVAKTCKWRVPESRLMRKQLKDSYGQSTSKSASWAPLVSSERSPRTLAIDWKSLLSQKKAPDYAPRFQHEFK